MKEIKKNQYICVYSLLELLCSFGVLLSIFLPWLRIHYTEEYNGLKKDSYHIEYLWLSIHKDFNCITNEAYDQLVWFEFGFWSFCGMIMIICDLVIIIFAINRLVKLKNNNDFEQVYRKGNIIQSLLLFVIYGCSLFIFVHPGEFQYNRSFIGYYGFGIGWYMMWWSSIILLIIEIVDFIYKNLMRE
ncbi:MAG: hypothetical protein K6E10_05185 [Eubacterium sp.]|nr:hypothetical protein [Eubacterium sp.]